MAKWLKTHQLRHMKRTSSTLLPSTVLHMLHPKPSSGGGTSPDTAGVDHELVAESWEQDKGSHASRVWANA